MKQSIFKHAACVQFEIVEGDTDSNLGIVKRLIAEYYPPPGTLLVLPELWATGFGTEGAKTLANRTPALLDTLQSIAVGYDVYLAGSFAVMGDHEEQPFNALCIVGPDGALGQIAKKHLFTPSGEHLRFRQGYDQQPVATPFGKVAGLVCYDLRFPELARAQLFHGCNLLVISAQWPRERLDHWRSLVQARAIENQVFVVATNSCGVTGKFKLGGQSMIVGPDGAVLAQAGSDTQVCESRLDQGQLDSLRTHFCPVGERPWLIEDKNKLLTLPELLVRLSDIRSQGSKVAFTNGCFDLLHAGHVSYLEQARRSGDCLVVGLNSDRSVGQLKGPSRPVNSEVDRARVLSALGCVDFVVIFDTETPQELIEAILPDILVKGADWPEDRIIGAPEVKANGGRVERIVFEHERSTSALIEKIQEK